MTSKKKTLYIEIGFCVLVFVLLLVWMGVQPFETSPDEAMRYDVIKFMFNHGTLPHGGEAEIRNEIWGISYAFHPYLSGILSAVFMKITSIFTTDSTALLWAARMVNVFLGVGTTFLSLRIGKRLFSGGARWLFTALVSLLPGAFFLFTYLNNDGLAIFTTALIILMWARSMQDGWSLKTCIGLAIGISLCALAYYNAYGIILCSIIFFVTTVLMCREKKFDWQFLLSRGAIITGIILVLAGWWFVRTYIIYDGDFLGMKISDSYAQQHAIEALKPSNRATMQSTGRSIIDMFFYVHEGWRHNWVVTVVTSFIGMFGYMAIDMPFTLTKVYVAFLGTGLIGILLGAQAGFFNLRRETIGQRIEPSENGKIITRTIRQNKLWRKENIFRWCMLIAVVIPTVLLVYYSYTSDLQAQGRYLMSALIPLMYLVVWGYQKLLERFVKNTKIREIFYIGAALLLLVGLIYTTVAVFIPGYIG